MSNNISFEDWLHLGYSNGWVGPPICDTHDGTPISEQEFAQFEDGGDPCVHILRLYEDAEIKQQVEESHSPSIWRADNMGLSHGPA
jgi:hypothetical protein